MNIRFRRLLFGGGNAAPTPPPAPGSAVTYGGVVVTFSGAPITY